jgi:hypothetical protein
MGNGVKRPGREGDHSPLTSAEVKNTWIYTSTPPLVFMAYSLINKEKGKVHLTLLPEVHKNPFRDSGVILCRPTKLLQKPLRIYANVSDNDMNLFNETQLNRHSIEVTDLRLFRNVFRTIHLRWTTVNNHDSVKFMLTVCVSVWGVTTRETSTPSHRMAAWHTRTSESTRVSSHVTYNKKTHYNARADSKILRHHEYSCSLTLNLWVIFLQ